jgi:hypothetical protein
MVILCRPHRAGNRAFVILGKKGEAKLAKVQKKRPAAGKALERRVEI